MQMNYSRPRYTYARLGPHRESPVPLYFWQQRVDPEQSSCFVRTYQSEKSISEVHEVPPYMIQRRGTLRTSHQEPLSSFSFLDHQRYDQSLGIVLTLAESSC